MTERVNELFPSPQDDRDWQYENIKPLGNSELPESFDWIHLLGPVRDQGSTSKCAAFTSACIKEVHEKIENPEHSGYFSPESVYFYRENKPTGGMYSRDVMSILTKYGCAREGFAPFTSGEYRSLSRDCIEDAAHFKIGGYAAITTIEGAKSAIYSQGPLLAAFPYYANGTPYFWRPMRKNLAGGHAVTIVGYNSEGFIIRNSWGSSWGNNGYIVWQYSEFEMKWELWSMVDTITEYPDTTPTFTPENPVQSIVPPRVKIIPVKTVRRTPVRRSVARR